MFGVAAVGMVAATNLTTTTASTQTMTKTSPAAKKNINPDNGKSPPKKAAHTPVKIVECRLHRTPNQLSPSSVSTTLTPRSNSLSDSTVATPD
jgi:hypothetical protein